jgi:hypothetical protein
MLEHKIADLRRRAHSAAFSWYIRKGFVPVFLTEVLEATASLENFRKYNPYHKPAGTPEGGQFDSAPGGGGSSGGSSPKPSARNIYRDFPDPDYVEPGLGHPIAPWEILLMRNTVRTILGSVFRQAATEQFYTIREQRFSSHSLDQMEARGIPPSVVMNAIRKGTPSMSRNNTTAYYDRDNDLTVIVGNKSKQVVTVRRGKP